jgi:hypothetical protein
MNKPTDKEIQEFLDYWEGRVDLPDPTHYPKVFMYYWKMWLFHKGEL